MGWPITLSYARQPCPETYIDTSRRNLRLAPVCLLSQSRSVSPPPGGCLGEEGGGPGSTDCNGSRRNLLSCFMSAASSVPSSFLADSPELGWKVTSSPKILRSGASSRVASSSSAILGFLSGCPRPDCSRPWVLAQGAIAWSA